MFGVHIRCVSIKEYTVLYIYMMYIYICDVSNLRVYAIIIIIII